MHSLSPSQPSFLSGIWHFSSLDTLDHEENAKKEKKYIASPTQHPLGLGDIPTRVREMPTCL